MSLEMALRSEKVFGLNAEMWLSLQLAYDLANAQKNSRKIRVKTFSSAA